MENKIQLIIVSGLIVNKNKILLAKRADDKEYYPGGWELPGGGVEFGESPKEALRREILEEVHVEAEIDKPLHVFSYISKKINHNVEIVYLCYLKKGEVKINKEDHSEHLWATHKEAIKLLSKDFPEECVAVKNYIGELND